MEALNRPEEEEIEPSPVLPLPAIWLKDLVPFPGEHYELDIDVAVRRAIATALVDHDLLVLVPARHRGIGVVAHLDELKRSRSGKGGLPAQKFGRVYLFNAVTVADFAELDRPAGRPKRASTGEGADPT